MRILYIIPSFHPGGAEYQTINQLNYLNDKGVDVSVVVLSNQIQLLGELFLNRENIFVLGAENILPFGIRSFRYVPGVVIQLKRILKTVNPTHILAILPIAHFVGRLALLGQKRGETELWNYHRSMQFAANPTNTLFKKLFLQFNNFLGKLVDAGHLHISHAVKNNITSNCFTINDHVLHNAIPNSEVSEQKALQVLGKKPNKLIVIPGRLHKAKGHLFFIESTAKYLLERQGEVRVVLVGDGPLRMEIEETIDKFSLNDSYWLEGFVNNDVMLSFLKLADLVVIPSEFEGFGNVAVEALMQGTVVLAANTGGLPEIITHNQTGYLFEKMNNESLLAALYQWDRTECLIPKETLIKEYQERFSLEGQIKKLLDILNNSKSNKS